MGLSTSPSVMRSSIYNGWRLVKGNDMIYGPKRRGCSFHEHVEPLCGKIALAAYGPPLNESPLISNVISIVSKYGRFIDESDTFKYALPLHVGRYTSAALWATIP